MEEEQIIKDNDKGLPEDADHLNSPRIKWEETYSQSSPPNLPCCALSKRYILVWMAFLGLALSFAMRINLAGSIDKMIEVDDATGTAEFDWDASTIGIIDSSLFFGYMISQIPGGYLAAKYRSNLILGICIAISAALNLLIPEAARMSHIILSIVRFMQGLAEGMVLPSLFGLLRWWTPPLERSRMVTLSISGSFFGSILGLPITSILTEMFGWAVPFYLFGLLGLLWFSLWLWIVSEKPSTHLTISHEERLYIQKSVGSLEAVSPSRGIPWCRIFLSMPVWAVVVCNFCRSFMHYSMLISIPVYLRHVLHFRMDQLGLLSVLPHLLLGFIVPLGGLLADLLLRKRILSFKNLRKLFNTLGFGVEAILVIAVTFFAAENPHLVLLIFILAQAISGFAHSGFVVNLFDIAPRYGSIIMGIYGCLGTLAGMMCPIFSSIMTQNETKEEWEVYFIVTGFVELGGVIFFAVFASGEVQPWAEGTTTPEDSEEIQFDN